MNNTSSLGFHEHLSTFPMSSTSKNELEGSDPVLQQFYHQESDALIVGHLAPENEEPGTHEYDFATTHEPRNTDH